MSRLGRSSLPSCCDLFPDSRDEVLIDLYLFIPYDRSFINPLRMMKIAPEKFRRFISIIFVFFLMAIPVMWLLDRIWYAGLSTVLALISLAFFFNLHPLFKKFAFTVWVFVFVSAALFYPDIFGSWAGFNLALLIVPLIQIIMFGMGTTLNLQDFTRVLKMPKPVLIGLVLQFSVMPLLAVLITRLFDFDPEIAAGIILVGSCPGGVASNLMAYLAGGNVALSVTMTSCSTMASPLMTPFLMQTFAGTYILIDFMEMMMSIFNMVIIPVVAGVFANKILYRASGPLFRKHNLLLITIILTGLALLVLALNVQSMGIFAPVKNGLYLGFMLLAAVALARYIMDRTSKKDNSWVDSTLTFSAMFGICFVLAIIISRSSDKLFSIGLALIAASVIHNIVGYISGYWLAQLLRLDEKDSRTIAFEVGMQNSGMASGLAINVLKSAATALPPAIFGPWMNISGSVLASWWKRKT